MRIVLLNSLVVMSTLAAAQIPVLQAAPVSVSFVVAEQGQPPAQQIRIRNTGSGTPPDAIRVEQGRQPLDWKASSDAAWLTVLPAGGTSPGIMQIEVSAEALVPRTHVATVTVTMEGAPDGPARIPIQVTVQRQARPYD